VRGGEGGGGGGGGGTGGGREVRRKDTERMGWPYSLGVFIKGGGEKATEKKPPFQERLFGRD